MPRPIFDSCEVTIQHPNQMFRSNNHNKQRLDSVRMQTSIARILFDIYQNICAATVEFLELNLRT